MSVAMKMCSWSNCPHWAQWVAVYADKTRRLLCSKHREELEAEQIPGLKFIFVGAIPDGINHT